MIWKGMAVSDNFLIMNMIEHKKFELETFDNVKNAFIFTTLHDFRTFSHSSFDILRK